MAWILLPWNASSVGNLVLSWKPAELRRFCEASPAVEARRGVVSSGIAFRSVREERVGAIG